MNLYPYTDFHELNDDWIIGQTKKNEKDIAALQNTIANLNFEFDRKADKATTYTKTEVDTLLLGKANVSDIPDMSNYYDKSETDTFLASKADVSDLPDMTDYYDKTETNTLLNAKADTSSLATVATSGSYNDLTNKPLEIKTITKSLTTNNDGAFNMLNEGNFNVLRMYINNENTVKVIDYLTYGNTLYAVPKNEARTQTFPNTTFTVTIISIA